MNNRVILLACATLVCLSAAAERILAAERWSGDGISWELPEGWKQREGNSPLRFAEINTGDDVVLVVSRFPGDVGGTLANVNRWRAQLNLKPIDEKELGKVTKAVQAGSTQALQVDLTSDSGEQRMLGLILPDKKNQRTWFFKLTGPAKQLGERAEKFEQLVKSVRLAGDPK
ncbi:MAG TPA: hypothetical protein VFB66_28205 [Tepidisphaeraceae bacterium]|nr:hypothetical protein [Tepidisphaeraceae bacterium]